MKIVFFLLGIIFLIGIEIARVYYIMPFPGSQLDDTVNLAYFLHQYIWLLRLVGFVIVVYPAFLLVRDKQGMIKWTAVALMAFWLIVFYAFNFKFLADKMFYQPEQVVLLSASESKVEKNKLVVGVEIDGASKAYPIEFIGYHHQVRDTLAGKPLMITYCTVCRTGRVFDPTVNGRPENFRLVGMDHFNAMFEDETTKSWWRQVSGEAIVGPLKGTVLVEIPSRQMLLSSWLELYPNSLVLQPDPEFQVQYDSLADYDEGNKSGSLEKRDTLSWKDKSWVVGISLGLFSKAYDWNDLKKLGFVNDEIEGTPILITLEDDGMSHHSFSRVLNGDTLTFEKNSNKQLVDSKTQSIWTAKGVCVDGALKGNKLSIIQSYQEFWHSWKTFHPNTSQYKLN